MEKFFPIFPTINDRCRPRNLRLLILYGNYLTEEQTPYKIWEKQRQQMIVHRWLYAQFPCTSTGGRYINPLTFLHTCKDMHVQANMLGCHNKAFQPHASKLD